MSRELRALPASLFVLHLGVTPEPLSHETSGTRIDDVETGINRWEAMDLAVLKAGDNEIVELQVRDVVCYC